MKLTGPDAVPPPFRRSNDDRMRDRLTPGTDPPLKIVPFLSYQLRIESIVSSTDEDEARTGLLRDAGHADVEPHGLLNGRLLGDDEVLQLGVERLGLAGIGEVAALDAPPA
jgi:hypothetical protein